MKKSNKLTIFYCLAEISLLFILLFGGGYGVYLSVGLSFVNSSMSNLTGGTNGTATNVAFGGMVNFESSMTGVVILSVALIVLAIIDIILLIKQIVFFKQFKIVRDSSIEKNMEKKGNSKGMVLFFSIAFDIITFAVGVVGIFVNNKAFVSNSISWVLYLIDSLVAIFAVISLVLLIIKYKRAKSTNEYNQKKYNIYNQKKLFSSNFSNSKKFNNNEVDEIFKSFDIDELEYYLLKLEILKMSKMITETEYQSLRQMIFGDVNFDEKK